MNDDRVLFGIAGEAMRGAIWRASRAEGLTLRDYRVLCAVLALTASWSKLTDQTYLGIIAAVAYGVDEAEPWQIKRTKQALKALDAAEVLIRQPAPPGRPKSSTGGPRYVVSLTETGPNSGPLARQTGPKSEPVPDSEKGPELSGNGSQPCPETGPDLGAPTEDLTKHPTEEEGGARAAALRLINPEPAHSRLKRQEEMRVKLARFTTRHGDDRVAAILEGFPEGAYTYASEVIDDLKAELKDATSTNGHHPAPTRTMPNPFELDDQGMAVRVS